jgi:TatD-related deoxyribonuclease|tara:strand:+ start:2054 stop:2872 length:819 start_codon:yes stop_codon:yes gene_type:complete
VEITDNHFHLDPEGRKELAVKDFLNAGGTRLVLVHKPYNSWKKLENFKEQVNTTLTLASKAREVGAKVAVIAAPHPVTLVKLLDHKSPLEVSELYLEAVNHCTNLVNENEIVGLGELGRPHFSVDSKIWELANEVLSESLSRAKEVDASVVLHTETGTPEVMADLAAIASKANFPKDRLVKHYGGPGSIEEPNGLVVSLTSSLTNISYAALRDSDFMLETDYLDDPNRPGAVMGPKSVPRKTIRALDEGIITEKQAHSIHSKIPDRVYREFT